MRRASCVVLLLLGAAIALGDGLRFRDDQGGTLTVVAVAPDVVRIGYVPSGVREKPTEMLDPKSPWRARTVGKVSRGQIETDQLRVTADPSRIMIGERSGNTMLVVDGKALQSGTLKLVHRRDDDLYGARGIELGRERDPRVLRSNGLLRNSGASVSGGAQGDGGAPLCYSTHWGLLIDSIDGDFRNAGSTLEFTHGSRKSIEAYIDLGPPERTMEVATELTGHPPLFPKWGLGFMNSQWKTDEAEVKSIIATYRQKQIPIDAFIMDFDFKAWGEDDFGEFRWNSTNAPGNFEPDKYPDGQSGVFGKEMSAEGIHLVGIMKPRVLIENTEHKPSKVAEEATKHGWFMKKKPYTDYFSHRLANDFDFSNPELRKWYWQHSKGLFDTGISGWWNDEADDGFDSLGFFHMQESLYEGQRRDSKLRVWSLNRNFYLGAQRFAFGTWSGDIGTGFDVMRDQLPRMLTIVDLDQPNWSMDTGGFGGHPSPENYARWMEFAAAVPIMRVHNTYGEHRQPWVYGPVAEAAAVKAIKLRYSLFPSLYSWQWNAHRTGVGIVRPLFWEFPDDPKCANVTTAWMLGSQILVSPVVDEGQQEKQIYLPPGKWFDYSSGKEYAGGETITIPVDSTGWTDLPMFVRSGSIVATQPVVQYMGEKPIAEITLDVWPDADRTARFEVYDDDGETYAYEHGGYFRQPVGAKTHEVDFEAPKGSYRTTVKTYRVRIHGENGQATWNRKPVPATTADGVLEVTIPAGKKGVLSVSHGVQ